MWILHLLSWRDSASIIDPSVLCFNVHASMCAYLCMNKHNLALALFGYRVWVTCCFWVQYKQRQLSKCWSFQLPEKQQGVSRIRGCGLGKCKVKSEQITANEDGSCARVFEVFGEDGKRGCQLAAMELFAHMCGLFVRRGLISVLAALGFLVSN